jgi:hypothetical protein
MGSPPGWRKLATDARHDRSPYAGVFCKAQPAVKPSVHGSRLDFCETRCDMGRTAGFGLGKSVRVAYQPGRPTRMTAAHRHASLSAAESHTTAGITMSKADDGPKLTRFGRITDVPYAATDRQVEVSRPGHGGNLGVRCRWVLHPQPYRRARPHLHLAVAGHRAGHR